MAIVYKATNRVNGKRYIGVTRRSLNERVREHLASARGKRLTAFSRALAKYGASSFDFVMVAQFDGEQEALDEEARLITVLSPEYNMSKGSLGSIGLSPRRRAVVHLNSGQQYGCCADAARSFGMVSTRVYQLCHDGGATKTGHRFMFADAEAPPVKKVRSPTEIEASRKRKSEACRIGHAASMKPVICLDDGLVHESVSAAARAYGLRIAGVSAVCLRSPNHYATGHRRFRFVGDTAEDFPAANRSMIEPISPDELWVPIRNFEGFYEISNYARVRGVDRVVEYLAKGESRKARRRGKIIKPHTTSSGRAVVRLCVGNTLHTFYLDALVIATIGTDRRVA